MKEEDIRLIKQEIKNNREAGKCGLASNNEKFEWTKTADALEKLLDYITNLQEENEKNKEYSEFYKDMSDKWKELSGVFKKSCEDYKVRIDKAIEYIEFEQKYSIPYKEELIELLNILQGEQNE